MSRVGKVYNRHHRKAPPGAVYIGRGSGHGNPYVIGEMALDRDDAILKHKIAIARNPKYLASLDILRDQDVVCSCAPHACHGDILVILAAMTLEGRLAWAERILKREGMA